MSAWYVPAYAETANPRRSVGAVCFCTGTACGGLF